MLQLIRSQSRTLFILLLIIIGLSFVVFTNYNTPNFYRSQHVDLGKIHGHSVTPEEFQAAAQAAEFILTSRYGGSLPSDPEINRIIDQQAWQRLLALDAAQRLSLTATDTQVRDSIRQIVSPTGILTQDQWTNFAANALTPRNITAERFEEIIREEISIQNLLRTVASPVHSSDTEVREAFNRLYGNLQFSVVRLNTADFLNQATVTPQEIEKQYQDNPDRPSYRTPATRQVAYAAFPIPASVAKLEDKDKAAARHQIEEKAIEFGLGLLDRKDLTVDAFKAAATQAGASVGQTDYFSRDEAPPGVPPSPAFNRAAFQLTSGERISDRVETDSAYYVLFLAGEKVSEPLPLAQVSPTIEKELKARKARELVTAEGARLAPLLKAAVASGKTFATAATEQKLTVATLPAFVPASSAPNLFKDESDAILSLVQNTEPGQVSAFTPTPAGGIIASLDKSVPPAEDQFVKNGPAIRNQLESHQRQRLLKDWYAQQASAAGTVTPKEFQLGSGEL